MVSVLRGLLVTVLLLLAVSPAMARDRAAWTRHVGPTAGSVALAVEGGVVVTVTWNGDVVGLDAETGRERWRLPAPADQRRRLVYDNWMGLAGGVAVVARGQSRWIEGRVAADGTQRWRRELPGAPTSFATCPGFRLVAFTHRGSGPFAGTLVASAIDPATGADLWQVPVAGELRSAGPGLLFVSDPSGIGRLPAALSALRCENGERRPVRTDGLRFPAVVTADERRVVVAEANGGAALLVPLDGGAPRPIPFPVLPGTLLRGTRAFSPGGFVQDAALDSPIVVRDLESGTLLARSAPRVASNELLLAGPQVVASFGGSRTRDTISIVDPDDLRSLVRVAVPSAASHLVFDERRAYAATYDGSIVAVALPRPAPPAAPLRVLRPLPAVAAAPVPTASFRVAPERTFVAHPERARSSGALVDGTVNDLAFLADDTLIATGGNDDRVRIFRPDGAAVWASAPLRRDVEQVVAAGRRVAARIYGGGVFVYDVDAQGAVAQRAHLTPDQGWSFGMAPSGSRVVADDLDGTAFVLEIPSGRELARFGSAGTRDDRAMTARGRFLVRPVGDRLGVIDLDAPGIPTVVALLPSPPPPEGADLVQAWALSPREIVVEWCTVTWCETQIVTEQGARFRQRFDTNGAQWAPTVPSMLEVSPDRQWLYFHRNGLEPLIVRMATGERVALTGDEETRWASSRAAFSTTDPTLFALTGHPTSREVTLFRITPAPGPARTTGAR